MDKFIRSLNSSFTRYINTIEAIGYQEDREVYKLICGLFILHCFNDESILHNLTDEQIDILHRLEECLYVNSCLFRKTDMICSI